MHASGAVRLAARAALLASTYTAVSMVNEEHVLVSAALLSAAAVSLLLRRRGLPWPPLLVSVAVYVAYTLLYSHVSGRPSLPALRFPAFMLPAYLCAATLTEPEKRIAHRLLPRRLIYRAALLQSIFNGLYREARETMLDVKANYSGRLRRASAYTGSLLSSTPSLVVETAEYMVVHGISTRARRGDGEP